MMKLVNSAPVRKGKALLNRVPHALARLRTSPQDYAKRPPIIVNSLPKSGTHLLLQISRALPGVRYYGGFIATTPSLTLKERPPVEMAQRIKSLLPGETVGAHIYHSPEATAALRSINAVHLFIYRDPRDVLLSGSYYLAKMNRWHRMHKVFSRLDDPYERLKLAIEGYDALYPSCEQRIAPYTAWLDDPNTLALKYEDLVGPNQTEQLNRIANALQKSGMVTANRDEVVNLMKTAINPGKSHTFREGGIEKWRQQFDPKLLKVANQRLASTLEKLGYPHD